MQNFSPAKNRSAFLVAISKASCSGVVRRMSGGLSFWRCRLWIGVSPLRVSIVTPRPISSTGAVRFRWISTASALSGEMYSVWTPRCGSPGLRFGRFARSTRLGRNPASVLPAPVGAISSAECPPMDFSRRRLWWSRNCQPRPENHRENVCGSSSRSARSKRFGVCSTNYI